jgi:hypothetical protein
MTAAIIGKSAESGEEVRIGDIERRSGLYVLGKPGMGKSAMLLRLLLADSEHGHGVFFLDPHGDAILDLLRRIEEERVATALLFDPEDETHSFGINLLACRNVKSLKERTDTYTRAYRVFEKLWEEDFGPWLQLILEYTLYVFIENQEYTLAEVPLFLTNEGFRNHVVSNVKYNLEAADFWRYEFGAKREREQQAQIQAALTRVRTLLGHPYVKHIIGQHKTTIDFPRMLEQPIILLMRLSANLAPDIRKFIGTILIGELLHAVRNRPEDKRNQYSIVVDEFQNFSTTDDFTTFITEARKFGIATTIAHQERFGQFAGNQKLMGATAAAANKIFFQLTVKDAEELAPEFADMVEATEKRREAELVISPRPVEDIWERGHPLPEVMAIRGKYFWIVEDLRNNPNEKYFQFDPFRVPPQYRRENPVNFQLTDFEDWDWYRSSAEMLRRGISLLNQYYYDWMQQQYDPGKPITDAQVELIIKVIECWGGVLGFLPMLRPVLPDEKRARISYMLTEKLRQQFEQEKREQREKIQAARDEIQYLKEYGIRRVTFNYRNKRGEIVEGSMLRDPQKRFVAGKPMHYAGTREYESKVLAEADREEKRQQALWQQIQTLEQRQQPGAPNIPRTLSSPKDIRDIKRLAIEAGMGGSEVEQLIEWEVKPLERREKDALAALMTQSTYPIDADFPTDATLRGWWDRLRDEDLRQIGGQKDQLIRKVHERYGYSRERAQELVERRLRDVHSQYREGMAKRLCPTGLTSEKASQRLRWQLSELKLFINSCFRMAPSILIKEPLKVPSGKYEESLKVERTQQDLINEMVMELSSLPRFTAYAKAIEEQNNIQRVWKRKIQTLALPSVRRGLESEVIALENGHLVCKERDKIDEEIQQRQEKWRRGGDSGESPPQGRRTPPPTAE